MSLCTNIQYCRKTRALAICVSIKCQEQMNDVNRRVLMAFFFTSEYGKKCFILSSYLPCAYYLKQIGWQKQITLCPRVSTVSLSRTLLQHPRKLNKMTNFIFVFEGNIQYLSSKGRGANFSQGILLI